MTYLLENFTEIGSAVILAFFVAKKQGRPHVKSPWEIPELWHGLNFSKNMVENDESYFQTTGYTVGYFISEGLTSDGIKSNARRSVRGRERLLLRKA